MTPYAQAHRRYHDWSHIEALLGLYQEVEETLGWEHPTEVEAAVRYHDLVYWPACR